MYLGLTLAERRHVAGRQVREADLDRTRGARRLAKWKGQPPFDSTALFQQRLEQWALSEAELVGRLSENGAAVNSGLLKPPAWAAELDEALLPAMGQEPAGATLSCECSRQQVDNLLSAVPAGQPQRRFLELVRPLMERAVSRLHEGVQTLVASYPSFRIQSDTLETLLVGLLPNRLLPSLLRTMVLELNVARVQGLLAGETGEQRFESFIQRIQQPEVRLELFREYPVLGRQVVTALEQWLECSLEFFGRWCADWPAIRGEFSRGEDPGPLVAIEEGAGDSHRNGRSVWIIQCRSGLGLVYKPRSLAVDRHFQELLGWLNERGFHAPFRRLKILDRGAYGWEEFVSVEGCSSREEVARFYERAGGYLALLRGLAATDFHHENMLAAGEQPILIDLEALLHAPGLEPEPKEAGEFAGQTFAESVLGSGLLPMPQWSSRHGDVFDASGLGADVGKRLPMRRAGFKDVGTDQMLFARQDAVIDSADHQPRLNGVPARPLDYRDALERGFTQVYLLLEHHRDEWLAPGGWLERFAADEVRVVLRDTSRYGELLQEGSHPNVLRDALDRERLFDRLWDEVKDRPRLAQLIPAELEDLWRGDVPLFTTWPDSRDLWAGPHRRFENILNEKGLECARERFRELGPEDLKRQLWLLRSSLCSLATGARSAARSRQAPPALPSAPVTRQQFLAACCAIGDRLAETAYRGQGDIAWIGVTPLRDEKWVLAPLGLDLYDGVPGVGLFLAYLGAITGQERYTALAWAALETLRRRLQPDRRKRNFEEIGVFIGWGGIIYTLAHLGVLWNEPEILSEAHEMLEALPGRIEKDNKLDLLSGAAGCIAGLLCLQSCRPSPRVLELAVQCGQHLITQARSMSQGLAWTPPLPASGPLTGFSHGAAGIAWALLDLAVMTGEDRFRTAALGGLAYERSLYSTEGGNWPDFRALERGRRAEGDEAVTFQVAWCHGAPGIGLSRLLCRRHLEDPLLEQEIEVSLRTTFASGFGSNHSLCHGDLGNLELFLEAARAFPRSPRGAEANRLVASIVQSIERDGWLCGNPLAVESPGLMTGIAGIGYGLLRCADPGRVPSILTLAPPKAFLPTPLAATTKDHAHARIENCKPQREPASQLS